MAIGESIIDNIVFTGRMSTFGGPNDSGVAPDEGLELINPAQVAQFSQLFFVDQPPGTTGLARRLDTNAFYVACRWNFAKTPKEKLRATKVRVSNPKTGTSFEAQPVDWGPDPATGRVADLSDGLANALGLQTDQICSVVVPASAFAEVEASDDAAIQTPLGTWQVLTEEASEIGGSPIKANIGNFPALNQELNERNHAALCLSGGGIRSGSFALGLMQSLAGNPKPGVTSYLGQFNYLSTVSGGGYIGGWFSAWLTRSRNARNKIVAGDVLANLADQSAIRDEAPAIENLRVNSNYLTPKVGVLSADSWADLAMYLRNLILNWFVMVPVFVVLVLIAKATSLLPAYLATVPFDSLWTAAFALFASLLTIAFLSYQIGGRPTQAISNRDQKWFLKYDLLPATFAAVLLAYLLVRPELAAEIRDLLRPWLGESALQHSYIAVGLLGAVIYCISWFAAKAWSRTFNSMEQGLGKVRPATARTMLDMFWWAMAGFLFGIFIMVGLNLLNLAPEGNIYGGDVDIRTLAIVVAGPPWILLSHLVAEMIFVGVTSYENSSDDDREWLARSAGWYGVIVVGWSIFFTLLLIGTYLSVDSWKTLTHWLAPIGGMSGAVSLLLGKMPWTTAKTTDRKKTSTAWSLDTVLSVTVPLFAATLVIAASAIIDRLLFGRQYWPNGNVDWTKLLIAAAVSVAMAAIASYFININRFSLHALYRNRLIRAFLGASRAPDRPFKNLFTDFDDADNPHMHELWQKGVQPKADNWRPFHVINMALNVVSSQNLAWQERKAESFIVSPLHSGSGSKTFDGPGAYQRTEQYGDPAGISLGTAVAISGAAASPQMGYHSSPALAFLMSLFNVRLGWWLANPGHAGAGHYRAEGPGFALEPLTSEMFGLTTDTRAYVYLSDGGHFENLGLYEMIRRRCRYIVVSDAGCDPDFSFEDLGNAFRKIKIDLRVDIDFFHRERLRFRPKADTAGQKDFAGQKYFCLGIIKYREADGGQAKNGILLYVKPGLRGDEPPDIASYAMANPTFPHESTSDQWFSESQFESYRHLGFWIGQAIVESANPTDVASPTLPDLLRALVKNESEIEDKYGSSL
jgi:hypothetical protein